MAQRRALLDEQGVVGVWQTSGAASSRRECRMAALFDVEKKPSGVPRLVAQAPIITS